ncbi:MAG: 16S rRNA (cytosine(967)-C(5))-methyltransferase RsmB [Herminiimonas sp.]|nr:16S rRNA (cytosine(967)-C(5))-methyltransferase RsmB [Herminiimonas sp.]
MTPTTTLKYDSLAFALHGAALAVQQVRAGDALPQALTNVFARSGAELTPQARGAIQDLSYRTLRALGRADALLARLAPKAPSPPILHALLCCALALISDPAGAGAQTYNAHTVVDQAVTAAASDQDMAHAKGMVNAVLRRFLRERDSLLEAVLKEPTAFWNYPTWWIDSMETSYPRQWQAVLAAGNAPPPLTLRVNRRRTTVADYLALLAEKDIAAEKIGESAVRLAVPVPVNQIPGFGAGLVSVQDAGAQLAAPLLDVADGMRVLDACAAPGGKSGHLLESADIELTALDNDARRMGRITENLERLQLSARLLVGDAASQSWWDGRPFDRILADVPCTASGIVRRHPDIRWLRRKADSAQLATLSSQILDNLWQMLVTDGKLLFVTCSVWPQESEGQAAAFAERNQALRLPAPGQLLPGQPLPEGFRGGMSDDHDGLFYALFQKRGAC